MARSKAGAVALGLAAFVFVVAAVIPSFRGGSLNATYLALAVVFFVLAVGIARQAAKPPGTPGA